MTVHIPPGSLPPDSDPDRHGYPPESGLSPWLGEMIAARGLTGTIQADNDRLRTVLAGLCIAVERLLAEFRGNDGGPAVQGLRTALRPAREALDLDPVCDRTGDGQ